MRCTNSDFLCELDAFLDSCGLVNDGRLVGFPVNALSIEEAEEASAAFESFAGNAMIVCEDRWRSCNDVVKLRILAHFGIFSQVYARNCEIRRIDKIESSGFLEYAHSYGDASCRYRYGLFLKSRTGESSFGGMSYPELYPEMLVAVGEFSSARKFRGPEGDIRSYEWVRYASLPGIRVVGGMGKILKGFVEDVGPDDVMSYADLEWSGGRAYGMMGFAPEGRKDGVLFYVEPRTWRRIAVRPGMQLPEGCFYFKNWGSVKFRFVKRKTITV